MEKKDPQVFSKKEKIIITSIFAILFLASIIVTVYLVYKGYPEQFGWLNFLPVVMILVVIIQSRDAYVYIHKGFTVYDSYFFRKEFEDMDFTYDDKYLKIRCIDIVIFSAQIPFQLPLIFYIGTDAQSLLSFLFFLIPMPIGMLIDHFAFGKEIKELRKKRKKEKKEDLEEQRQRIQQRFRDNMYK